MERSWDWEKMDSCEGLKPGMSLFQRTLTRPWLLRPAKTAEMSGGMWAVLKFRCCVEGSMQRGQRHESRRYMGSIVTVPSELNSCVDASFTTGFGDASRVNWALLTSSSFCGPFDDSSLF